MTKKILIFLFILYACIQSAFSQHVDTTARILTVESIRFPAMSDLSDQSLAQLTGLQLNSSLDLEKMKMAKLRLKNSGFFKNVQILPQPGSEKGQIVVTIEAEKRKVPYLIFAAGLYDMDGWTITPIGVRQNIFNRSGEQLKFDFRIGGHIGSIVGGNVSGFYLEYANNGFNTSRLPFSIKAFIEKRGLVYYHTPPDTTHEKLQSYIHGIRRLGGSFTFDFSKIITRGLFVEFRMASVKADSGANALFAGNRLDLTYHLLPDAIQRDIEKHFFSSFDVYWYRDTRDNHVQPTRGKWTKIGADISSKAFGSDYNFIKYELDYRRYFRTYLQQTFAVRLRGAYIMQKTDFLTRVPFYENYYLGGTNSVRGYLNYSLSPAEGANKFFVVNSEYRIPLISDQFPRNLLTGIIFLDVGNSWSGNQEIKITNHAGIGTGFGFRAKLPVINVIGLDIGFPLTRSSRKELVDDFTLHFFLGYTF